MSTWGDIVTAFTSGCAGITTVGGYNTTVVTATENTRLPLSVDLLPAVDVREVEDVTVDASLGSDEGGSDAADETHELHLDVECAAATMTAARNLAFDVRKMIRDTLTDTYDIMPESATVDVDHEERKYDAIVLRFRVRYHTGLFDAS